MPFPRVPVLPTVLRRLSPRRPLPAIEHAIQELAPGLERGTPPFRAAVVLLCAPEVGHNIDRIGWFTRYERNFVALCARRLVDNGVWSDAGTVCAWNDPVFGSLAFTADVGVAEGKLYRRTDRDGHLRWARTGEWRKAYDFVSPMPAVGQVVRYDPAPRLATASGDVIESDPPVAADDAVLKNDGGSRAAEPRLVEGTGGTTVPAFATGTLPDGSWLGRGITRQGEDRTWRPTEVPSRLIGPREYAETVRWLG